MSNTFKKIVTPHATGSDKHFALNPSKC